ncbi:hypothetical protein UREG_03337 [Uncinocarpus reesii 1704]|uniref:NADH:ubiquinone reductase (non-electrogenic) n=1 Tax=Uncinocarpus reesii (strain UAMH 1704) TaxID=336963 RepID=C4JQJ2_UNCRE|nr:uncharacterized protein UREG_03337 [Uncinocarpus reesii 1704]EEP78491.1 hypothetical protein UREG_03337 [Uncinocarpus reesii 1704]
MVNSKLLARPALRLSAAASRRPLSALSQHQFTRLTRPILSSAIAQAVPRRTYAQAAAPASSPAPAPKKRFRLFRWFYRLILLSLLGGVGTLGYSIYSLRHPAEQFVPDPEKKTLVILGTGWGSVSLLKKLDTENYNVVVISPRNFFLFTPLLPSCTTGLIEHRSIMEPVRNILRHKAATVKYYEAKATKIDYERRVVQISDESEIQGETSKTEVPFDMLVVGVGAANATFGIPGVEEHSCFLKEVGDAQKIRKRIMDCVETAIFKDQTPEEVKRLLHMVVVGGGPTGVEFAGELQDFFNEDLKKWVPDIKDNFHVTLVEALPNVQLPCSPHVLQAAHRLHRIYFQRRSPLRSAPRPWSRMLQRNTLKPKFRTPMAPRKLKRFPYGLLVWATGNAVRPVVKDLISQIPAQKNSRRGLAVNEYLVVNGTENIWGVGDCAITNYAPTAQVASQEGAFLARLFNTMAKTEAIEKDLKKLSIAHTPTRAVWRTSGKERAVADISWLSGNIASGGTLTYLFWRSAYLSMCFSTRNRVLVAFDWIKAKLFGRDVSRE